MGMTRILYASDFHGSDACFRKFISAAFQYQANVLIVGGDVTGKAMIPIIHLGGGSYRGYLFGRKEEVSSQAELEKLKQTISNVGFYPIVLEPEEAQELENDSDKMGKRFEHEMVTRVQAWMALADDKLTPKRIPLYFMPGNDDLDSIDAAIEGYQLIHNPDGQHFWLDDDHELVGMSKANMTPWLCPRDTEEDLLETFLADLEKLLEKPAQAVVALHVPPFDAGIDVCPQLDENLKIMTSGGQVLMKPVGSTAVRHFIERVQPMLSLHGHIHESPGYIRIGRTLCINAGSEYAEGILKAAIINLERDRVKGHLLVSA